MPKIEIARDVYAALQRRAVPFEDDVNDVLRRLLRGDRTTYNPGVAPALATSPPLVALASLPAPGLPPADERIPPAEVLGALTDGALADDGPGAVVVRRRGTTGEHLPQSTVRAAVLGILRSTHGPVGVAELVRSVERQLHRRLTERDLERLPSGLTRWQSQVRNALTQLQHEGQVERVADDGYQARNEPVMVGRNRPA